MMGGGRRMVYDAVRGASRRGGETVERANTNINIASSAAMVAMRDAGALLFPFTPFSPSVMGGG